MISIEWIIWIVLLCGFITLLVFIFLLGKKIQLLEKKISFLFQQRIDYIPGLYEISKAHLQKQDEIFKEILTLRKQSFWNHVLWEEFLENISVQTSIHNELNFIFKVCNAHKKLTKKWNFIYLQDLVIEKSYHISEMIQLHSLIVQKYNTFIKIKNMTIIGSLIPLCYKNSL